MKEHTTMNNTDLTFQENMTVEGANGEKLGDLKHVVVDPRSKDITHLVIEQGFFFTEDKLVPLSLVHKQEHEKLVLERPADQIELQSFTHREYVARRDLDTLAEDETAQPIAPPAPRPLYHYPSVGAPNLGYPYTAGAMPATSEVDETAYVEVESPNVDSDKLVVALGASVKDENGRDVGEVSRVFTASDTQRITHFMVEQGILFTENTVIPIHWIDRVEETVVHLAVTTDELDTLAPYEG